ncbi:hypothetical protein C0J52_23538 [Blattella germanica]|nr:hypothetical protein C0J52_23538 [Blattella germanica]
MSLYFNIYFFPIWLVTVLLMLDLKYQYLSHIYSFIVVMVLVAVIGIELLRLHIGCMGNLTEKVRFCNMLIAGPLLQFPLQLFLLVNENTKPFQMERAIQGIFLSFLVVQIFSGFFAVRHASRHQANCFHRMQFTSASDFINQYRPLCKKD